MWILFGYPAVLMGRKFGFFLPGNEGFNNAYIGVYWSNCTVKDRNGRESGIGAEQRRVS